MMIQGWRSKFEDLDHMTTICRNPLPFPETELLFANLPSGKLVPELGGLFEPDVLSAS